MEFKLKTAGQKRLIRLLFGSVFSLILLIALSNWVVFRGSRGFLYSRVSNLPYCRVGMLLGTSPRLSNGAPNYFFVHRIDAAALLYRAKKVRYLLVSGDNRHLNYNEPQEMRHALIKMGVPDSVIVLDYAGIRTFDSVIRSEEIFGLDSVTIISQRFHNQRAVFIARRKGMVAVGFNAQDVDAYSGFKTKLRESLACVKVFFDLWFNAKPHHLGSKVPIGR